MDFSATADIKSAINLVSGNVDVIRHVDQQYGRYALCCACAVVGDNAIS